MPRKSILIGVLLAVLTPAAAFADELTQIIQKDLLVLGYDPGNIQGEMTTETIVAISKFQAENGLDVTGEASPQLAGIIKAQLKSGSSASQAAAPPPARDPAALQAAQQACLTEKYQQAQAAQKKKRGLGSLMRAVGRTAARFGGNDFAREMSQTTRDVYDVNATAADLESAAEDLGLTPDEVEECRNPPM